MNVIVYGDFNCRYSYLASQRADLLSRAGGRGAVAGVEHHHGLPVTGSRADGDQAAWDREPAEVASLALPREQIPAGPPVPASNTKTAMAAYARRSATASPASCAAAGPRPGLPGHAGTALDTRLASIRAARLISTTITDIK